MPAANGGQGGAVAGADAAAAEPVQVRGVEEQVLFAAKRTREMFAANYGARIGDVEEAKKVRNKIKVEAEYSVVKDLPPPAQPAAAKAGAAAAAGEGEDADAKLHLRGQAMEKAAGGGGGGDKAPLKGGGMALQVFKQPKAAGPGNQLAVRNRGPVMPRPEWHAPWKLMRVISGHLGWVRCVAVDSTNEWFATGAGDRTVKLWDLASGELKITLTGHISPVRGVAISDRHPYMFTVGEDKLVKCWDLETNMVIRHYHGHLSGVYCCALHPTLDILCTGGRDSSVRVWDMRSKNQIFCLAGHKDTVGTLACQATDPQIISGSQDSTVRLWDLAAGKAYCTLTHHKKSVRSVCTHPTKYLFASASSDNIKQWQCPDGVFMKNVETQKAIVNCITVNRDDVFCAGYDNGSMQWFDWRTGYNFQTEQTRVQPGSLESEAGIYAMTYDKTGTRLITCEADKTIKVYKEDETATPESHPVEWQAAAPGQEKRW